MPADGGVPLIHVGSFLLGAAIVIGTVLSAVRTFVLPRSAPDRLTRVVFVFMRALFSLRTSRSQTYEEQDARMAFYAPLSLLMLPLVWMASAGVGYMLMYWGLGVETGRELFELSGSSLLTLGFDRPPTLPTLALAFSEAAMGLTFIALLISYLPAMYGAFQRREALVTMLEVRAGSPPSAIEFIMRYNRLGRFDRLQDFWQTWETWFTEIEESHTSLPALVFFRSPRPEHSWVTAAGTVLDSTALILSVVDIPRNSQGDLCVRAGYLALRHIADYFRIPYNPNPSPLDSISITREEFDEAVDQLVAAGVPIKADRDQGWRAFAGWRVNYDVPLLALAELTMAPYAPWTSDRGAPGRPRVSLIWLK
jgi:hypothetical protein